MTQFKVELGDLSGDGHCITRSFVVEVPDRFSLAIMDANYNKNVAEFGFGPRDFAKGFDGDVKPEHKDILVANGFPESAFHFSEYSGKLFVSEGIDGIVDVCMFFVGHGLDGFTWKVVEDSMPVLFGFASGAVEDGNVGYRQLQAG